MTLTPTANALPDKFRQLEKDADAYLHKTSRELSASAMPDTEINNIHH
jgi:hypothetical protein